VKIRLYLDEDSMRHALVGSLRAHGVDVLTAFEAGMIEKPDEDHLAYATAQGRVLCTFNIRDFFRLHAEYLQEERHHTGIILVAQQRYPLGEQVRRILRLIAIKTAESMHGQAEFLSAWKPEWR